MLASIDVDTSCLVLGLESNIALAAVRSLGRRGIPVVGVAARGDAIGLRSRYLRQGCVVPWDRRRPLAYIDEVFAIARRHRCAALLTPSETMMRVFNGHRADAPDHLSFCFPPADVLEQAMSKEAVIAVAARVGLTVPRTESVRSGDELGRCVDRLGYPVMLKFSSVGDRPQDAAWGFKCRLVETAGELARLADELPRLSVPLLVQEYAHGRYESVGIAIKAGEPIAVFQWAALREYAEGLGAFRVSLAPSSELVGRASALLREIGYEGVAEVEFRHDLGSGRFTLMEVNPRLWGGVALPIACGVDFPWLSYAIATGLRPPADRGYQAGRYGRNLSGDVRWLGRALLGRYAGEHPNLRVGRLRALGTFVASLVRPAVLDQESWGDLGPLLWTIRRRLGGGRPWAVPVLTPSTAHRIDG